MNIRLSSLMGRMSPPSCKIAPASAGRAFARSGEMEATAERELKYETLFAMIRLAVGLGALIAFVSVIGWRYRAELASFGEWFVERFGAVGMIVGTALADGITSRFRRSSTSS